ncbi:MAG: hypothetical protein Q4G47_00895 [Lachnospiraceae bacterium]|nr:hypothetical protein [Lachnospiraceae bacterium]
MEIFRKKSLERLSAPEDLTEYLRVTNPSVWIFLVAVIALIVGTLVWAGFASFHSRVYGTATVEDGMAVVRFEDKNAGVLEKGMPAEIGSSATTIESIGKDTNGKIVCICSTELPNGTYDFTATYKTTQIISLLFG